MVVAAANSGLLSRRGARPGPGPPTSGKNASPRHRARIPVASQTYLAEPPGTTPGMRLDRPASTGTMSTTMSQPARIAHARHARHAYIRLMSTTTTASTQDIAASAGGGFVMAVTPDAPHRHGPPKAP